MATFDSFLERNHKPIIAVLSLVIVAMVVSCAFDDLIPVCHYLFGCDHAFHGAAGAS